MNIVIVWGQRKCRYEGKYAPELLEAVDEYTNNNNSEIIDNAYTKELESQELGTWTCALCGRVLEDTYARCPCTF